jgi:DNA-binding SARP family transcriptional activator/tRNA A-37 threonylcarbamoyl transferase component Bud32
LHDGDFRVYLTGGVRIEFAEMVLGHNEFSWPRSQLVFAYLVCERGRPIPRAELRGVLWSDAPPSDWESALTTILERLRRTLRRKTPGIHISVIRGDTYELRFPGDAWVDIEAATNAIHDAEGALKGGRPRDAFGPSAIAHHISRRSFLPGESGRWVESWRQRLRTILLRALECRAEIFLWNSEQSLAIDAAREMIALEPLRETGHQLLIRSHVASGNAAEAKRAYEQCRITLMHELGVEPSQQTTRVYEEALRTSITSPRERESASTDCPTAPPVESFQEHLQQLLGDAYRLERELSGGMSRVFVAEERALGRRVVVKALAPDMMQLVSAERFAREVRIAAKLQQANIVPVLTAGVAGNLPYYTMPFVAEESLRGLLRDETGIPIARVKSVLRDVARALAFAHSQGVIHRDIKPENILLSGETAVVTDFGIAKALDDAAYNRTSAEALTRPGTSLGTPQYMAPEQVAGDPGTDHRADIYSFGVVAYELLAGRAPFIDRSARAMLEAHLIEPPRDIRELRPDTPPALANLVMKCLRKDPMTRPATMNDVLSALV